MTTIRFVMLGTVLGLTIGALPMALHAQPTQNASNRTLLAADVAAPVAAVPIDSSARGPQLAPRALTLRPSSNVLPQSDSPRLGAGSNVALMVVGGAAIITGAIIGGGGGAAIAVGGGVIGLYGLYRYLR